MRYINVGSIKRGGVFMYTIEIIFFVSVLLIGLMGLGLSKDLGKDKKNEKDSK